RAARARASPSGITSRTKHGPARPGEKACLDQEWHRLALGDLLAVEPLDREALPRPLAADVLDQAGQSGPEPALVGIAERDKRAAAALDEEGRLAAQKDDLGAGDSSCSRAGPLRPRKRRAIRVRPIGRGPHEHLRVLAFPRSQLTEPLDRAAERELGTTEALDEVATPAEAERLERLPLGVDGGTPAGNTFGADAVAGDDALALEQELRQGAAVWALSGV